MSSVQGNVPPPLSETVVDRGSYPHRYPGNNEGSLLVPLAVNSRNSPNFNCQHSQGFESRLQVSIKARTPHFCESAHHCTYYHCAQSSKPGSLCILCRGRTKGSKHTGSLFFMSVVALVLAQLWQPGHKLICQCCPLLVILFHSFSF